MSESKVVEEMLADAFADMKTGRRVIEKISEKNQSLAEKFVDFTKKLLDGVKKFFKSEEVREKYPEVILTNRQFKDFVSRVDENICSIQSEKKISVGYKILQSQYKYSPKKQKKLNVPIMGTTEKNLFSKFGVFFFGKYCGKKNFAECGDICARNI